MTFNSIMASLKDGQAATVPGRLGYLSRSDAAPAVDSSARASVSEGEEYDRVTTRDVRYSFHENNNVDPYGGTADTAGPYVFVMRTVRTESWVKAAEESGDTFASLVSETTTWLDPDLGVSGGAAHPLVLDSALLQMFASTSWTVGSASDAAAALAGKSTSRW